MSRILDCTVCGSRFDPASEAACSSCPLNKGCPMVCCPHCGHTSIDVGRSRLARLIAPLVHGAKRVGRRADGVTLADIEPGRSVVVEGFCAGISEARRRQLEAYAMGAGRPVTVLQQAPVTVIRIDHTEIALESDLAAAVLVRS